MQFILDAVAKALGDFDIQTQMVGTTDGHGFTEQRFIGTRLADGKKVDISVYRGPKPRTYDVRTYVGNRYRQGCLLVRA